MACRKCLKVSENFGGNNCVKRFRVKCLPLC